MDTTQQKIAKTSKVISTLLFIGCVLTGIAIIIFICVLGATFLPGASTGNNSFVLQLQANMIPPIIRGVGLLSLSVQQMRIIISFGIVQCGLMLAMLYTLRSIFAGISEDDTPFEKKHVKRIKWVALFTLLMSVASDIFNGIVYIFIFGGESWSITVELPMVAVAIYCIALVFDYGCQLQQQSDETL